MSGSPRNYDEAIVLGFVEIDSEIFDRAMEGITNTFIDQPVQCTIIDEGKVCIHTECFALPGEAQSYEYISICRNGVCRQRMRKECKK